MFSLTVALPGTISWRLLFKTEERAREIFKTMTQPSVEPVRVEDDFGQEFFGTPTALLFEDMAQSKLAMIELSLHQARAQTEAQKAAQHDPALRANRISAGPAMIHPGINGR